MRLAVLVALTVLGCGRHGFDLLGGAGDGGASGSVDGGLINGDALPVTSPRSLAIGTRHTCAVLDDGSLWCWGDGRVVPLAFAGSSAIIIPTRVGTDSDWARVASSGPTVCAIKTSGTLWCMGAIVGDGTSTPQAQPVQIGTATDWASIDGGRDVMCGLRTSGQAFCWGDNTMGAVGNGVSIGTVLAPAAVMTAERFSSIAVADHVCAIATSNARLWCWGSNSVGALGDGTSMMRTSPVQIGASQWLSVTVDLYSSFGVQMDGTLWGWGTFSVQSNVPKLIDSTPAWTDVVSSAVSYCGHRGTDLWCSGSNARGQLAAGDVEALTAPTQIDAGSVFGQITMRDTVLCAVRDGVLGCAGNGAYGQLGDGLARWTQSPRTVAGAGWKKLAVGRYGACSIAADDTLWCWGSSTYSQLTNIPGGVTRPTLMESTTDHVDVAVGGQSVAYRRADNTIWYTGQIVGLGYAGATPAKIGGATWASLSLHDKHVCGRYPDNAVWCVGSNGGALGNNSQVSSTTVVQAGTASYLDVATGSYSTYGIQSDGSLWSWGNNTQGQLGLGDMTLRTSPTRVENGTTWSAVSGGYLHGCGIRTDGSLWCWGDNTYGQLGDGTTTRRLSPTRVGTATGWTAVSAGGTHTCALAGTALSCWGANDEGQLGDGTLTDRPVPVAVGSGILWTRIATGTADGDGYAVVPHSKATCGLDSSGTIHCWGDNSHGIVGDGTGWATTLRTVVR